MKRFLSLILSVALLLVVPSGLFSITASAETVASGTCGENLTWTLKGYTLTVSGTVPMTNYASASAAPWYPLKSSILGVVIDNAVCRKSPA